MGIYPDTDTFEEFSTQYGQRLCSYIRHRPWVTAGDTASGYAIPNGIGTMHNGYSGGFNVASFRDSVGTGTNANMGAALWRQVYLENARSTISFRAVQASGTITYQDFRFAGVCARVTGGTFTNTLQVQDVKDTNGYWFGLAEDPGVGHQFILLRVSGGVVTLLDSKNALAEAQATVTGVHQIQLEVKDESGNVRINTYYDGEQALVSYLDSSVNKLTAAGRCGFGMTRDRQLTSPTRGIATICSRFSIFDIDAGATVLADDFTRLNIAANNSLTDGNGATGRSLQSMWTLDVHSIEGYSTGGGQTRDPGLDRVRADTGTYQLSQISATSPYTQSRSIRFNMS